MRSRAASAGARAYVKLGVSEDGFLVALRILCLFERFDWKGGYGELCVGCLVTA